MLLPPDEFGHGGFGGSDHGAWPSARLGYSYVPNYLGLDPESEYDGVQPGPALVSARFECLAKA